MSKQHYGFAIIGAGVIGRSHAQYLQRVEKGKLVVICDKNEENGRKLAGACGCDWSGDIHAVLSRSDVDIVTICLPSGMHAEYTILAARAGKHVITEKPIDIVAANARRMIEACRKAGVKLAVISQHSGQLVPVAGVLRQRRLARDMGVRWGRRIDEPRHPHRGCSAIFDGTG
jgi:UDP-N-acetyl-2-amino-2-deoxyglucuronate dehydrogenase